MVGIACSISGRWRWAIWTGWVFTTFGLGLLVLLEPDTNIPAWVFINIPVSIGTGMLFPAMGLGIQAAARPQDAGHAAAFFSFTRVFGQSVGVAVGGVVFQNQIKQKLLGYPLLVPMAAQYSADATGLVHLIKHMEHGLARTQLIAAYTDALKMVWIVMCALSGAALVASLFTKGYSFQQVHNPQQGFNGEKKAKNKEELPV